MPINKLKTTSIETDAITADLLAAGSITVADIPDAEITDAKLHTNLDFSTKTFTMHNNHITQTMVTQHQAQLAIGADQIDSGSPTFGGDVTITGNLTVNGTTTTLNTETLTVDDNIIVLNNNEAGTPSQNAGIEVERGTSANVDIRWNETTDKWQFTNDGTTYVDIGSGGDVVDDTTPQLGGALDAQSYNITNTGNIGLGTNSHIDLGAYSKISDTWSNNGYGYLVLDQTNAPSFASGPNFVLNSAGSNGNQVGSTGDWLGTIQWHGYDAGGSSRIFAFLRGYIEDATASGTEGQLWFYLGKNGGSARPLVLTNTALELGTDVNLKFEGATSNDYETTLTVVDPTADRTITLPNATGTLPVFTTAPTGAIADGTSGQVLTTDGNGGLSFTTASGGGATSAYAKFTYEISATVNSVSGNDTNGNTLSYSAGNNVVEVFVNGVKQQEGSGKDYQATTGNSVVFTNNLYSGDLVDVVAYNMFSAGNINIDGSGNLEIGNNIIFEGATANAFETTLTVTDPTADRTITLPDKDGTVLLQDSSTGLFTINVTQQGSNYISSTGAFNYLYLQNSTSGTGSSDGVAIGVTSGGNALLANRASNGGTFDFNSFDGSGNYAIRAQIGASNLLLRQNMSLAFEGATDDGNQTTLTVVDPTADRTISLPDATGTLAVNIATDSSSIILGDNSGTNATAATNTTVLGSNALNTGNLLNSVAIGKGALELLPTGNSNVAIGYNALRSSSSGNSAANNVAIGYGAADAITTGDANVVIGINADMPRGDHSSSIAIGNQAKINGNNCIMIGVQAGGAVSSSYTDGNNNVAIGDYALYGNGSGDYNTVVGGNNLRYYYNNSGYNVGYGYGALYRCNSQSNTAVGYFAMYDGQSNAVTQNVALGLQAGRNNRGNDNIYIGSQSGGGANANAITGSNNIMIGRRAEPSTTSVSNEITLGNSTITTLRCQVTSITALSDERDKTAIEDLDLGLDFIKAMKPRKFTWNRRDGKYLGKQELGFIAQELYEVEQDFSSTSRTRLVNFNNPSRLEAQPMNTYPILVKAIQELSAKVDSLQAEVNTLKNGG